MQLIPGYIKLVADHVKPSFPDFTWSHATNGEKDEEGVSIVKLEVRSIAKLILMLHIGPYAGGLI